MNQVMEVLLKRRSIRAYEDREIPAEVRMEILKATLRAPTAGNMMLYTILEISDPSMKDKLNLDQVEAGKRYEIVITNLLGGAMVRYRVGDIVLVTGIEQVGIGVTIDLINSILLLPALMAVLPVSRSLGRARAPWINVDWLADLVIRRRRLLLYSMLSLAVVCSAGMLRIDCASSSSVTCILRCSAACLRSVRSIN